MKFAKFWPLLLLNSIGFAQTWSGIGSGFNGCFPSSFYVQNSGTLVIGMCYTPSSFAGTTLNGVCRFNGFEVDSLNQGITGSPNAIKLFNGKLFVGGSILCADEPPNCIPFTNNLAVWDSVNGWGTITPNGAPNQMVKAMEVYNNELYIGGQMTNVNGVSCNRIAKWNGTTWSDVAGGVNGSIEEIRTMAVYHGQLYVGGNFQLAGPTNLPAWYIARWNGVQWDTVGSGLNSYAHDMIVDTINDLLYVAGGFTMAGGVPANGVAVWNDTAWAAVGPGTDTLWGTRCLAIFNGELYAGGGNVTITAAGDTINNVYKFDGVKWTSVDGGASNTVEEMCVFQGNLYIGGYFTQVGYGIPASHIACYGTTCPTGVGIAEPPEKVPFTMYPNPTDEVLHITTAEPKPLVVRIYNSAGQLVFEENFSNQIDLQTSSLSAGNYTVQVSEMDGSRMHSEVLIVK